MVRPEVTRRSRVLLVFVAGVLVVGLAATLARAGTARPAASQQRSSAAVTSLAVSSPVDVLGLLLRASPHAVPLAVHRRETTHISAGTLTSNTEWTTSGSPYVLDGNVTVASGGPLPFRVDSLGRGFV
jgi:hypothetical protein